MKPCAEETDGFYGGTLTDADYSIRQTYLKKNFLARGYSLRKVKALRFFWRRMDKKPAPQLSEPGAGNLAVPSLISMRTPILKEGELEGVVSMIVRTETFLETVGLDQCSAFQLICRNQLTEEKGTLSENPNEVKLALPSTQWTIRYDP